MYYKIRNDILYRQYKEYGYITDNSEYGYQFLDDTRDFPGENYVSESGAVMLSVLGKTPRYIDDVVDELMKIFQGVGYDELKKDTIDFFQWLTEKGYLSSGDTFESCISQESKNTEEKLSREESKAFASTENCTNGLIKANDFLRSIHFDITSVCNERCVHCYIPHKQKTKVIDPDLFYRTIEQGRKLNIIHVTLSGGEPLLHKDFLGFLSKCRELDLSVNVLSNLTLLTEEMISEMKRNPLLSVQTSIYSMDSTIHDKITGVKGSFEKTVGALLKLHVAEIPLQISCPVMKQNKESFAEVMRWGKEHSIAVAVEPVIFASYDHSGNNLENRLSIEELEEVLDKQLAEGYVDIFKEAAQLKEALTENDPICSICRYSFCVSVDGNVFPCAGWQTNILGDLKKNTVQEIWENSEKIKALRKIKRKAFEKCISCENRGYCTVCMMSNANEDLNGNAYEINDYHCKSAAMIHQKVRELTRDYANETKVM